MFPTRPSVLVIGHGSSASIEAEAAAEQHALTLRQSHRYGIVDTCFLATRATAPSMPEGEIFLLPFFMSNGYFVKKRIPELFELEAGMRIEEQRQLYLCDALGVDPELADILITMGREVCAREALAPSAVRFVLVAHGSEKSEASAAAARLQARAVVRAGIFADVTLAFLNETPYLREWLQEQGETDQPLVLTGLFAAEGPHAAEDVPGAIADWRKSFPAGPAVHYAGAVGVRPEIVKLIQHSISRCAAKGGEGNRP